ncbi:hypothetical protein P3T43_006103 [Paraburkholderia sp. GAS41]|uniref:DNA-binding protein n=1 Tax=Paraburkholderia sp. GAS41 TaxID=3035134 RepID=UPI003D1B50B8
MKLNESNVNIGATLAMHGIEATLSTADAAAAINRKPQTLRRWAALESGPLRPLRINGRLAWRVTDLKALTNKG